MVLTFLLICAVMMSIDKAEADVSDGICFNYGGKSFFFRTTESNWQSANENCKRMSMSLTKLYDTPHQKWISQKINYIQKSKFWIGANDLQEEGKFIYTDNSSATFSHWGRTYPNDANSDENCLYLYNRVQGSFINDKECSKEFYSICEAASSNCSISNDTPCVSDSCSPYSTCQLKDGVAHCSCLPNYSGEKCEFSESFIQCHQYKNKGFLFVDLGKTFNESSVFCESRGMKLAKIYDKAHHEWTFTTAFSISSAYWTFGLNDIVTEGEHGYEDGTTAYYTNWDPEMTNENAQAQDCIGVFIAESGEKQFVYHDYLCDTRKSFICESLSVTCNTTENLINELCKTANCSPYQSCIIENNRATCNCTNNGTGLLCEISGYENAAPGFTGNYFTYYIGLVSILAILYFK